MNPPPPHLFAPRRAWQWLTPVLVVVLLGAVVLGVAVGAVPVPLAQVAGALLGQPVPEPFGLIIWELRLPRVALIALAGAALAASGAAYQGLFRNPLADPYLVGVASGAGLGATVMLALGLGATLGLLAVPLGAFVGGVGVVLLVLALARQGVRPSVSTILLAGVAIGALTNALTTLWMLRSPDGLRRAFGWLLGGYAGGGWWPVWAVLPYVVVGLAVVLWQARALNLLQLEEEQAAQLGLNVAWATYSLIAAATLMTAAAVSFAGLIGFVGLVVPHALRTLGGPDYRWLVPLSALGGAGFLVLADVVARTVLAPQELPLGLITALIGAPVFVLLLLRLNRRTAWWS